jgi:hypothetical protein
VKNAVGGDAIVLKKDYKGLQKVADFRAEWGLIDKVGITLGLK